MYKIASSTARNSISRGRPKGLAAGICGSIRAHSASVTSLAYRCPSRSYFGRVISVHIVCLDDFLTQPSYHNRLKSLISFSVSLLCGMSPRRRLGTTLRLRFPGVGTAVQLMTDGQLSQLELVVDRRESGTRDRGRAFYADVDIGAFAGRAGRARTEQKDAVGRIGHMPPDHRSG